MQSFINLLTNLRLARTTTQPASLERQEAQKAIVTYCKDNRGDRILTIAYDHFRACNPTKAELNKMLPGLCGSHCSAQLIKLGADACRSCRGHVKEFTENKIVFVWALFCDDIARLILGRLCDLIRPHFF